MNHLKRTVLLTVLGLLFGGLFYLIATVNDKNAQSVTPTIADQVKEKNVAAGVKPKEDNLSRTDSQGSVSVKASVIPEKSNDRQLVFELVLNTHSIDLSEYDIAKASRIFFDGSEKKTEFTWKPSSKDSHHMSGILIWNGQMTVDLKEVNLRLVEIDSIPVRSFSWKSEDIYQSAKEGK